MATEEYSMKDARAQRPADADYAVSMQAHFTGARGTTLDKLNNFPRFVSRQALSLFLAKSDIFRRIVGVHGCIVEAGVFMGGGLFTWSQLSAIHEPINYNRKVIGFDTFEGFPEVSAADTATASTHPRKGELRFEGDEELRESARLHDLTRPLGHIPKVELVKGPAEATIPAYLEDYPHLVVALLYLDFDLFEPTKVALEHFLPRMPRGSIIAFDELNQENWPGETLAVLETVGIRTLEIQRFPFTPSLSFAVL